MPVQTVEIGLSWFEHGRGLSVPRTQSAGAAGVDLMAAISENEPIVLPPGQRALIPCGFAMALPDGYEAQVRPRSGLAIRHGITVLNAPGTIDADYRGEVQVILINFGQDDFSIRRGDRVAQMVVAPFMCSDFILRDNLNDTERGKKGFGSTGHKTS
ncbi:dUTP diphosphatase [Devosia algicola]|uniref:Deoxyuridine 5'-triphosphate nucleotidohydrolase n=1 Tax=Devosia algicola TaxID=3026418 RepID=A0ABY7YLC7_9HYPH|nr:dUTP diphosphatase [Devosia algicola]WDR02106.1 dUTP diphosphatase [Devosia algicola]